MYKFERYRQSAGGTESDPNFQGAISGISCRYMSINATGIYWWLDEQSLNRER